LKKIFPINPLRYPGEGLQDLVFLVGIFLFISIMIIGLFPGENIDFVIHREYFIYAVMTVPVVAAIYFIIIAFQRKRYADSAMIGSSIRKKMALFFVFVALLPSLPIVIASNYFINQTMSHILEDRPGAASGDSRLLSRLPFENQYRAMEREIRSLRYLVDSRRGARQIPFVRDLYREKEVKTLFFAARGSATPGSAGGPEWIPLDRPAGHDERRLSAFYCAVPFHRAERVDSLTVDGRRFIAGALREGGLMVVLFEPVRNLQAGIIPAAVTTLDFGRLGNVILQFKTRAGIFFFMLSIIIIVISVVLGLYLSKSITRPVLELSEAAKKIASGDFNVVIERDSEDELGLLYGSFNSMVRELDRNRKTMYQKQKLEAWREMARRLVHEIKNPLTPIRLSAERIRKRYAERHPDIQEILMSGTETIIEEVDVLMGILSEFTKFARLPEMKAAEYDINEAVENCAGVFASHEGVEFHLDLRPVPAAWVDRVLIRQALMNLIQNAIDAIRDRGNIFISTETLNTAGGPCIQIKVRDEGIGIREEDMENIFSPGFSTKPQGTGLGLAIVEKILMEHGGRIYCESKLGSGTEFVMEMPVKTERDYRDGKDSPGR
jgi:nitrogen fixation/metabolism regulation signal transduction histidine kinase